MNDYNLIRFDEMTPERHRELSRLGGIASGKQRRLKAEEKRLRLERSINFLKKYNSLLCDLETEKAFRAYLRQRQRKARKKRGSTGR